MSADGGENPIESGRGDVMSHVMRASAAMPLAPLPWWHAVVAWCTALADCWSSSKMSCELILSTKSTAVRVRVHSYLNPRLVFQHSSR